MCRCRFSRKKQSRMDVVLLSLSLLLSQWLLFLLLLLWRLFTDEKFTGADAIVCLFGSERRKMFDNLRLYLTILFSPFFFFSIFRRPLYFSISVFLCACFESCEHKWRPKYSRLVERRKWRKKKIAEKKANKKEREYEMWKMANKGEKKHVFFF